MIPAEIPVGDVNFAIVWHSHDEWTGTVDMMQLGRTQYGTCSNTQNGQADFVVDNEGVVHGIVTGNWMSNNSGCNPGNPQILSGSGTWPVTGHRVGKEFQLTFYGQSGGDELAMRVTVPISGNKASTQGTDLTLPSADGPINRTVSINLKCATC